VEEQRRQEHRAASTTVIPSRSPPSCWRPRSPPSSAPPPPVRTVDEKTEKDVIVCGQFWTISAIVYAEVQLYSLQPVLASELFREAESRGDYFFPYTTVLCSLLLTGENYGPKHRACVLCALVKVLQFWLFCS